MKNLTIDYKKEFGKDGTVYTQTITTTKEIIEKFNDYVKELKEETAKKFILDNNDMKILYYLEELKDKINYIGLTTLDYFKTFYIKKIYNPPKRDLDFERIKWRNTIIKIK